MERRTIMVFTFGDFDTQLYVINMDEQGLLKQIGSDMTDLKVEMD